MSILPSSRLFFLFLFSIFLLSEATVCFADEKASADSTAVATKQIDKESVKPGINDNFLDPDLDVDEWVERFEVESREVFAARNEVLEAVGLKPGMRVADIGAGTGLYTTLFADQVGPAGWVYGIEIAAPFVVHLREVAQKHDQGNVTPVLCDVDSIRLPPNSIDVAFTCDVYHHFEYPDASLASIWNALKPGGRLIVVDFEKIPGETREWLMDHVRADKQTVKKEITGAGFEFSEEKKILGFKENYFLEFRKPGKE